MLTDMQIADRLAEVLRTPYRERFIGAQIAEALDTSHRLEPPRKLGASNIFRNLIVAKTDDDIEAIEWMLSRRRATPDEEALFDEVIVWITPLPVRLRKLMWLRADGHSWRYIGRVMGVSHTTTQKLWRGAAAQIAELDQKARGA